MCTVDPGLSELLEKFNSGLYNQEVWIGESCTWWFISIISNG